MRLLKKFGLNNVYKEIPNPVKETQMLKAPARTLAAVDEIVRIDTGVLHSRQSISEPLQLQAIFRESS